MSYHDRLITEINKTLDDLAAAQEPWAAQWVAHKICGDHAEGLAGNDDAMFWRHCGYVEVRDEVRRCINRRAGDKADSDDQQMKLPGYDHLHAYYVVRRNSEDVGVPIHEMTDAELEEKSAIYRSMAKACYAHADELDRFRRLREALPLLVAAE